MECGAGQGQPQHSHHEDEAMQGLGENMPINPQGGFNIRSERIDEESDGLQ